MYRIGQGFDIHKFAPKRKFILGGIEIDYEKGLDGHSDADALSHAITDALLGALALGDIGIHFPDDDPKYKNINSLILLKEAGRLVMEHGYKINNIDSTILVQEPKMQPYIPLMKEKLAKTLNISQNLISIKAKTMENMDSVGEKKSLAVYSVVLLAKSN